MKSLLTKKPVLIILAGLLLASSPLFAQVADGVIPAAAGRVSATTAASSSAGNMFDRDYASAWTLEAGAAEGWAEIGFDKQYFIFGLDLSANLPAGLVLSVDFYQNGEWHAFSGARVSDVNVSNSFIDLSFDRAVTDRVRVSLAGSNAAAGKVYELAFRGRDRMKIMTRMQPKAIHASDNTSYLFPEQNLCDGSVYTEWKTSISYHGFHPIFDDEPDAFKEDIRRRGYEDRCKPSHRSDSTVIFDLENEAALGSIQIYFSTTTSGDTKVYVGNKGQWRLVATIEERVPAGWRRINLNNERPLADQVKIEKSGGSGRLHEGIAEVEIWGFGDFSGDAFAETGVEPGRPSGDPVNTSFSLDKPRDTRLEVEFDRAIAESPKVEVNGQVFDAPTVITVNGKSVAAFMVPARDLEQGENYVRVRPLTQTAIVNAVRVRIIRSAMEEVALTGALNDGILFQPIDLAAGQVFAFGRTVLLKQIEAFGWSPGDVKLSAWVNDEWREIAYGESEPGVLVFPSTFATDKIKVETTGTGPGELRVLASPTLDSPPRVTIIWPADGDDLDIGDIAHGKLVGFVDNPNTDVIVNGQHAEQRGHYFWIDLDELNVKEAGVYQATATAKDQAERTGSDSIEYSVGLPANFRVDQGPEIIFTDQAAITISGHAPASQYLVKINGQPADISNSKFSKTVGLEIGFNRILVSVFDKRSGALLQNVYVRVVRTTGAIRLTIDDPLNNTIANSSAIQVSGRVEGASGTVTVTVNGKKADLQGTKYVCPGVAVADGTNTITVTAKDAAGKTATAQVTVIRDTQKPVLSNILPAQDQLFTISTVIVTGKVTDASKVWVYVNDAQAALSSGTFSITLNLLDGKRTLAIEAVDAAGNRSGIYFLRVVVDTTPPAGFAVIPNPSGWTNNPRPVITFSTTDAVTGIDHYELKVDDGAFTLVNSPYTLPAQVDGEHLVVVKATDKAGWATTSSTKVYIDTTAPGVVTPFFVIPGKDKIILEWKAPSDDIVTYQIYRDTNPNTVFAIVNGDTLTYTDAGLVSCTPGQYRIVAIDRANNASAPTDWTRTVVGVASGIVVPDAPTVVQYDNVRLFINENAFKTDPDTHVVWVEVSEMESPQLAAAADWGLVSPIYNFTVGVTKNDYLGRRDHIMLNEEFICAIHYDQSKVSAGFPEQNLGVYYFDFTWGRWFKEPKYAVDTENNVIYFRTNHFSSFSVQPTVLEDLSPQELQDVDYSPLKTKSKHEGISISPQGGSVMTQMTELVLPGKNGFDFVLKRTYDSTTARADASGTTANMSLSLNAQDILGSLGSEITGALVSGALTSIGSGMESQLKGLLQKTGDYAYSMGLGWRLNLPYIRSSNSYVLVRTPEGAFHALNGMDYTVDVEAGIYRQLSAVNHENDDFTFKIIQVRADLNITQLVSGLANAPIFLPATSDVANIANTYNAIKLLKQIIQIPGWILLAAEMTMKDGTTYYFDMLGRVSKIKDPSGLNEINIFYHDFPNPLIDYIQDSMGRKILFDYDDNITVPRITRIRVENDPQQRSITYVHQQGQVNQFLNNAPLLVKAIDIGGREWNYHYTPNFLFSGGGGVKLNILALIMSFIPVASELFAMFGPPAIQLNGNMQIEFVYSMDEAWGPGIGYTAINNRIEPLAYGKLEGADYLFGIIPTAVEFTFQIIQRVYANRLTVYEYRGGPLSRTINYMYDIFYRGEGQFLTSHTLENDGRTIKDYYYANVVKGRLKWLTWSDYAAELVNSDLFTSDHLLEAEIEFVPYNTSIVTRSAGGPYLNTQTMAWDTKQMRLIRQRIEYSGTNYQEANYSYDDWGNPMFVRETNCTGDRISETETWSIYNTSPSSKADVFTTWPSPYSAPSLSRPMFNLQLGQVVKNNPPPEAGLSGPTYLVTYNNYNSLGQMTASSQWTGTDRAETTYIYNAVHGSPESVTKPNGHVTSINYDYDFTTHPGFFYVTATEKDVKDADGHAADIVDVKAFDFTNGNLVWEKNPRGFVTQSEYDGLGRVTRITEPDDDQVEITWDPRVTPDRPNGANNPVTLVQYNDTDLWSKVTNAKGKTVFYDYDQLGRLVRIEKENAGNAAYSVVQVKNDPWNNITDITDPNGNVTNYEYDFTGRMTRIVYPPENGSRPQKSMSFDYASNLLTTTDENGHTTRDVLNLKGKLLQRTQYSGLEIVSLLYYDSLGNQVMAVDPMGNTATNLYDCRNLLERSILPQAKFFENGAEVTARPYARSEYDIAGVKTKDISNTPNGEHEVIYETDGLGRVFRARTSYTDAVSGLVQAAQETFYDAKGNQVRVIDAKNTALKHQGQPYYSTETVYSAKDKPLIQAVNVKRDAAGNLLESGKTTRMTYDILGNVLTMTDPRGTSGKYSGDFTLVYHYDDLNRLVQGDLPAGTGEAQKRIIEFIYDPRGNLMERHEPDGAKSMYTYTPRNKVATETVADKDDNTKYYTTTHLYDLAGNEKFVIDNMNNKTEKTYDELNRVTSVIHPQGNSETLKYDLNSNVIKTTDGKGNATKSEYDAYKRLTATVQTTVKNGEIRYQFFYDRLGNKTKDQDPNSNINLYQYDEINRLIRETTYLGFTYTYRYDEVKNIIESIDANGTKGVYTYTPDNLVDTIAYTNGSTTLTTGGEKTLAIHYEYDEAGAVKSALTDGVLKEYNKQNGNYTPDPYDRILAIDTTYAGKTTRVGYECDNRDRITAVVYPNGSKVEYQYNTLSQLKKVEDFIDKEPEYNGVGLISKIIAANGTQTEYRYDANLRLTNMNHTDKDGAEIRSYALKYDDANNIVEKNKSSYTYDEINRLVYADLSGRFKAGNPEADQPAGLAEADYVGENALTFDIAPGSELKLDHNSRSVGVNLGKKYYVSRIELHPDVTMNRLIARSVQVYVSDLNSSKAYHQVKDVTFVTRKDGVIELRLKEAQAGQYVKVHCYFDDRDEEGNSIPDAFATTGNTALKLMKVFYMVENRQDVYNYDAIGNRTSQTISEEQTKTTNYTFIKNTAGGDSQRLQSDGTYNYEYDNDGNLKKKTEIATGNTWEYEFDLLNRLVAVYRKESADRKLVATYIYDEAGYRLRKVSTEKGTTDYVFSAHGVVLFEERSSGEYKEYIYVFNDLFAKIEGKATGDGTERKKYFYHTDHLGSTTAITDESGKVVWKNDFTPFGTETGYEGTEEHDAKFTGKDFDEEICLYYFNARWYDPELGRFISQDPIKDGVNWYVYCSNRPLSFVDPSGLDPISQEDAMKKTLAIQTEKVINPDTYDKPRMQDDIPDEYFVVYDFLKTSRDKIIGDLMNKYGFDMNDIQLKKAKGIYLSTEEQAFVDLNQAAKDIDAMIRDKNIIPERVLTCLKLNAVADITEVIPIWGTAQKLAEAFSGKQFLSDINLDTETRIEKGVWGTIELAVIFWGAAKAGANVAALANAMKVGNVEQYALKASRKGLYPIMKRGFKKPVGEVLLGEGDVWKYGTTKNPATRYPQTFLDNLGEGVYFETMGKGSLQVALQMERAQILQYLKQAGILPPGNKIIK